MMTAKDVLKAIKDNDIKFILAQFVDIHGSAKAKAVPAQHLDMILSDGAGFAGFALWGFGMGPQGPNTEEMRQRWQGMTPGQRQELMYGPHRMGRGGGPRMGPPGGPPAAAPRQGG